MHRWPMNHLKSITMANLQNSAENEQEKELISTPPFPYQVFPQLIQDLIIMNCNILNLNIDYCSVTLLFSFATAMGSHYMIKVRDGWIEMATLFMVLVGKPGINKSAPLTIFTKPLEEIDMGLFQQYLNDFKQYKLKRKSKEISDLDEEPVRRQLVIKDATQEALLKGLYENQHGFGGIYDELGSFLKSFNKYNGNGGDEELMLSLFSGKSISVNRKNSPPFLIAKPFLSIIGSLQPQILISLLGNNRIDNGLTHRFLFAFPDQVLRHDLSEYDVPEELSNSYTKAIGQILKTQMLQGDYAVKRFTLSKDAFEFYKLFRREINYTINNEKGDAISGIYAKLDTYFIRISLIIHVIRIACGEADVNEYEVSESSLQKAKEIIKYFEQTALKVFSLLSRHRDPLSEYPLEHKILYYRLPIKFTTKQAWDLAEEKISKRTLYNILSDDYLFLKIKHGEYEKIW